MEWLAGVLAVWGVALAVLLWLLARRGVVVEVEIEIDAGPDSPAVAEAKRILREARG